MKVKTMNQNLENGFDKMLRMIGSESTTLDKITSQADTANFIRMESLVAVRIVLVFNGLKINTSFNFVPGLSSAVV
jgi:hypothetical protein